MSTAQDMVWRVARTAAMLLGFAAFAAALAMALGGGQPTQINAQERSHGIIGVSYKPTPPTTALEIGGSGSVNFGASWLPHGSRILRSNSVE